MDKPTRRAEDSGLLYHYQRWKVPVSALLGAVGATWFAITWADDKIRKVEQVPVIAEAVLQLKKNQESIDRRLQAMEARQAGVEKKLDTTQKEIIDKLDLLVERR